jgi:predicted O-methyltransferase YrrM
MVFQYDWFDTSAKKNFEIYLARFKGKQNLVFLEIGPFEGKATVWLLENILTDAGSGIVCVDTFEGSDEHKALGVDTKNLLDTFLENIRQYSNKVTWRQGKSQEVLRTYISPTTYTSPTFDFIYIDGSHRAPDVLEDAVLSFRALKKGGLMIFDDYEWKYNDDPIESPRIAIDAFLDIFVKEYKLLLKGYQVVLEKI